MLPMATSLMSAEAPVCGGSNIGGAGLTIFGRCQIYSQPHIVWVYEPVTVLKHMQTKMSILFAD